MGSLRRYAARLSKCKDIPRGENMSFEQKVIIVTGAARGIGQEYCRRLAALGAAVIALDINACDQTVELVRSAGGRAIAGKVDVTDLVSIEAAVARPRAPSGAWTGWSTTQHSMERCAA